MTQSFMTKLNTVFTSTRSLVVAIVFIFVATAVFSGSFVLPYGLHRLSAWAAAIGISAALSWCYFINFVALSAGISVWHSLRICVVTMVLGNITLLASAVLNLAAWYAGWTPPFFLHVFVIGAANLIMFAQFQALLRPYLSIYTRAILWFCVQNFFFAMVLAVIYYWVMV